MQFARGNDGGFLIGKMTNDRKKEPWFRGDNEILASEQLSNADKLTFFALKTLGGCKKIYPSIEILSERCNLSHRSVKRGINKLEKLGYISVKRSVGRGNANEYTFKRGHSDPFYQFKAHKRGHPVQEKVTWCPVKGDMVTPQLDNELDKEKEGNKKELNEMKKYFKAKKTF